MPIRRLPEDLVNQIAAGEVVERPAAALRELVENALDAGAARIEVDLERGGKELLVVTDDGSGISKDEIPIALERHATSKLAAAEELHRIRTLGFRGEALPSIASVSKFRLLSRTRDDEHAWEIAVEGGKAGALAPKSAPVGTRVEVAGLFYNTPARRKFLKTDATELSHCLDFLTRLALVRPQIGFAARHGGQLVLDAPPTPDPAERAAQLLGSKTRGELFALLWEGEAAGDRVRWEGLLGSPQILSSNTKSIYLFVEGRPIRDRSLQHAVQNAYREVIVERKYPTVILNLRIDPEAVDVNIHPTKAEVRFRAPQAVYGALYKAVTAVLEEAPWAPAARRGYQVPIADFSERQERIAEAVTGYQAHRKYYGAGAAPRADSGNAWRADEIAPPISSPEQTESAPRARGFFESLDIVGQFHGEYLICQSGSALYLIDQHAAHERVAYERLRANALSANGKSAQALLVPQPVELPAAEAAALLEAAGTLAGMGFEVEDYGAGAVLVRQVPSIFSGRPVPEVLKECAQELLDYGTTSASERVVEDLCARMACHSVIRGPTALSEEEARSLLRQMDEIDFAAHCPHGRPVVKEFPISEIERLFKRTL